MLLAFDLIKKRENLYIYIILYGRENSFFVQDVAVEHKYQSAHKFISRSQAKNAMNNSDWTEKDAKAVRVLGKRYVKVPWAIINRMFDMRLQERRIGLVHLVLLVCSNYTDGVSVVNGNVNFCKAGEFMSTYDSLSVFVDFSVSTFRRCVLELIDAGLVDVERAGEASRFRVNGYEAFMRGQEAKSFTGQTVKPMMAAGTPEKEPGLLGNKKPRTDLLDF